MNSRVLNIVVIVTCSLVLIDGLFAQDRASMKVVFDVSTTDAKIHKAVLRHVKGVIAKYPDAKVAIVIYGGGLEMIQKSVSQVGEDLKQVALSRGVTFEVCQIAINNKNISPDELVEGIKIVPDGIIELAELQMSGYAYIKEIN